MVDLYTALALIGVLKDDDEIVQLCRQGREHDRKIFTVRDIKNKFDMRREKVVNIRPYFYCAEYEGMVLTLASGKEGTNAKE